MRRLMPMIRAYGETLLDKAQLTLACMFDFAVNDCGVDLNTFYNRVKRYITKNYIISEDKGYYIGPYCYELYLEGKYIPCNGRYRPVFRKKD